MRLDAEQSMNDQCHVVNAVRDENINKCCEARARRV